MSDYRIFISYSHRDSDLVKALCDHIAHHLKMIPVSYENIRGYGEGVSEHIKLYIRHAHVFMPVITRATNSQWVHEEIGYATALNVPVIPIAVGALPKAMIQNVKAIPLPNREESIRLMITEDIINDAVETKDHSNSALFYCADLPEDRAIMMSGYAEDVARLGYVGKVRQQGGLSSFHIPSQILEDPRWRLRYGKQQRSEYHCRLQRNERLTLSKHADRAGARILISPDLDYAEYGPEARVVRLESLIDFLNESRDNIEIGRIPAKDIGQSITIVGDWFFSQSILGTYDHGYRQTIFTCHAATIQRKILAFDEAFAHAEAAWPWPGDGSSRKRAIAYLDGMVADLKRKMV